jgi:hypothetical protein
MTVVAPMIARRQAPRHASTSRPSRWADVVAVAVVLAVATLARVVHVRVAYDVFIDEITYTQIAHNIAAGHGVVLGRTPFDLHPGAALAAYGLVVKVFGLPSQLLPLLLDLRYTAAAFGALACVGLFFLVRLAAPMPVPVAAALLAALDPFLVHYDSLVMLEAPSQAAAVATVAFLAGAAQADRPRRRRVLLGLAGLAAAVTACSKETFGFALGIALLALLALGWTHARRGFAWVLAAEAAGYAVDMLATGLSTGFRPWFHDQFGGLARFVGAVQITGFNAPSTHVSLLARVGADANHYAGSYLLLLAGAVAAIHIVWRAWRARPRLNPLTRAERIRVLIAVWTIGGFAYLAYATLFGTIEEQMYYICLLPAIASVAAAVPLSVKKSPRGKRRWFPRAVAVAVAALLAFDVANWVQIHTGRSTAYSQLVAWDQTQLPPDSVVAATDGISQFLLKNAVIGQWHTLAALRKHHVDYVVVSPQLTAQGYGLATPSLLAALQRNGVLVFSAHDPGDTGSGVQVYDVAAMDGGRL